jgi:hypothetical protein
MVNIELVVENLLLELTSESLFAFDLDKKSTDVTRTQRLLDYAEGRMHGLQDALRLLGASPEEVAACHPEERPSGDGTAFTVARDALWDCLPESYIDHDRSLLACWLSEHVLLALYKKHYLRAVPEPDGSIE